MFKRRQLKTENEQLKRENEALKRENAGLKEQNDELKQSLDDAVRSTRIQSAQRVSQAANTDRTESAQNGTDSKREQQLDRAIRQCTETRQQLLGVQERLTILEQVTAVTQRRELVQEGFYENIPSGSDYEQLRVDATEEHIYASIPTHTGRMYIVWVLQQLR